jgi:hypothetical protein
MKAGLYLEFETVDKITVANLKDARKNLKAELDNYDNGGWLHEDDVIMNKKLIKAMTKVIRYFGEE